MHITNNILQRTFQVSHLGRTATGYTIEKNGIQYLVSAAHIFDGSPDLSTISIFHNEHWEETPVTVAYAAYGTADTIVFKLQHDISPRHPIKLQLADVIPGTWAYFLGYPRGLRSDHRINNGFPLPFIKAALVSALDFNTFGICRLYLDGHNNKGFSGGPVVWSPPNAPNDLRIVGTIAGYVIEHPTSHETDEEVTQYKTNAGIVEAIWIKDLLTQLY